MGEKNRGSPSVATKYLIEMRIDEGLVGWTADFMAGGKARMRIDGDEMDIATGLPQWSAVSQILIVIYVNESPLLCGRHHLDKHGEPR